MTRHDKRSVIIGNGVAGTTAAGTLRQLDPTCRIHLLTNEPYPLYRGSRCCESMIMARPEDP